MPKFPNLCLEKNSFIERFAMLPFFHALNFIKTITENIDDISITDTLSNMEHK